MKPVRLFAVRWCELAVIAIFGVGFAGCAARSVTTAGEASSIAVVTQVGEQAQNRVLSSFRRVRYVG